MSLAESHLSKMLVINRINIRQRPGLLWHGHCNSKGEQTLPLSPLNQVRRMFPRGISTHENECYCSELFP